MSDIWADIRSAISRIQDSRTPVCCSPADEPKVKQALDQSVFGGLCELIVSPVCTDGTILVGDPSCTGSTSTVSAPTPAGSRSTEPADGELRPNRS